MIRRITILSIILVFSAFNLFAGVTGKITGTIIDADTNEPLIGANIMLEGTTMGGSTDLDGGYFILNVPPGKYNLVISYIGYQKQTITNVEVTYLIDGVSVDLENNWVQEMQVGIWKS